MDDYKTQGSTLKEKFLTKGYPLKLLEEAQTLYEQDSLPQPKKQDLTPTTRFITQYHVQHKKMEGIFKKHWSILTQDPHLATSISAVPKFAYRRAPNIKRLHIVRPNFLVITNKLD